MPPFVLTVLKIVFLALLYLFIYRAIRAVVLDLRAAPAAAPAQKVPNRGSARRDSKPRLPRSVVVIDERGNRGRPHPLDGTLQLGRADACQIKLDDTYASQFHAKIFRRGEAWYVEDLGSTNGTYVNQRRITAPAEVQAGDRVRVGKTVLELAG